MNKSYDDIIDLPHHVSTTRPRISAVNRAAQFAPFAALTGYQAAVRETARDTDIRLETDESQKELLNRRLRFISDNISKGIKTDITYFLPDKRKEGGKYVRSSGAVKKIDVSSSAVIMEDKTIIPMEDIIEIEIEGGYDI